MGIDVLAVIYDFEEDYLTYIPQFHAQNRKRMKRKASDLREARYALAELIDACGRVASHGSRSAAQVDFDWDRFRVALRQVKGEE